MPWLRSLAVVVMTAAMAPAADWPQWLGPDRDGSSKEKVATWKVAPERAWAAPVGDGHGGPVVAKGRGYIFATPKDKDEEELTAYDAAKGTKLWATSYARPPFKTPFGNGPRSTPTVADGKVYTFGATGILTCFDAENGTKVWQVDTLKKYNV